MMSPQSDDQTMSETSEIDVTGESGNDSADVSGGLSEATESGALGDNDSFAESSGDSGGLVTATSESEISDSGDGDSGGMVIEMTSFEVDATSDSTMIGEETPQIGGSAGNTD